jgi:hypothetical protein
LAAHTPAQHRVELVKHHGGEGGEDQEFQKFHSITALKDLTGRRAPAARKDAIYSDRAHDRYGISLMAISLTKA